MIRPTYSNTAYLVVLLPHRFGTIISGFAGQNLKQKNN